MNVNEKLREINRRRIAELEKLGDDVLQTIVKPVCDRFGLSFRTVNRDWWFCVNEPTDRQKRAISRHLAWEYFNSNDDAVALGLQELGEVFDTLRLPVDSFEDIGLFVPCYPPIGGAS